MAVVMITAGITMATAASAHQIVSFDGTASIEMGIFRSKNPLLQNILP